APPDFFKSTGPYPKSQDEQDPSEMETEMMKEPGIIEPPTMDMDVPFASGIFEFDGHYYILPIDKQGNAGERYLSTKEHLGRFDSLEAAQAFEKKYLAYGGQ